MTHGLCMSCKYFEREDGHDPDEGNCHRNPPVANWDCEDGYAVTAWPVVEWMDWCGEWEPNE